MKIFNLNVNDFGGIYNHLEEFKKLYSYRCMSQWDKVDKSKEKDGILKCINEFSPDIVILQEFDINSKEAIEFKSEMEKFGYDLYSETTEFKRPSMTVFFIKNSVERAYVNVGHELNGRAYAIRVEDIIIYGTHVPPKYKGEFWRELHEFVEKIAEEKYLLIGDFNTINYQNANELSSLLSNAYDVWREKGNSNPISIMGDYILASNNINVDELEIDSFDTPFSDHPIIHFAKITSAIEKNNEEIL